MSATDTTTPQVPVVRAADPAVTFMWRTAIVIAVLLIVGLMATFEVYRQERYAKTCAEPHLYPICERANVPQADPPASTTAIFLSAVLMATLAILLAYASWHASVIEQAHLISAGSTMGANAASSSTPENGAVHEKMVHEKMVHEKKEMKKEKDDEGGAQKNVALGATSADAPTPSLPPPKATPSKGVDPKLIR
jgi:hypothetical protein